MPALHLTMNLLAAVALLSPAAIWSAPAPRIDREALVRRHNPSFTSVNPHAPVMLGNGNLGFTADITGLQTFPKQYSEIAPLLTMAQWAWHSFPNPAGYTEANGLVRVPVAGRGEQPYAWMKSFDDAATNPALTWLRANPHRISLARIALTIDGRAPRFEDVAETRQTLDMWTGTLSSRFRYAGQPVTVTTRVHPDSDLILVELQSPLVRTGRLGVAVGFPGVAPAINPDPARWDGGGAQRTDVVTEEPRRIHLRRTLDDTQYWSTIESSGAIARDGAAGVRVTGGNGDRLVMTVRFDRDATPPRPLTAPSVANAVAAHWRDFWQRGGAIDFTGSTDPRASELERRVVLSQYLLAINSAGELPPQEEGLFSNSWYGKFHLEMHPWHAAWAAMWGRPDLLERSLPWYVRHLPKAREEAARHSVKGAWWPKMTGPEGRNSPSPVSPFLMWQQPHPILLAELLWRARRDPATLARYGELVEATADLLASWPLDVNGRLDLGPPLIPAQENYDPLTTRNPTFEVEYVRWGLATAQAWRERQGQSRRADWDAALARIAPPPIRDGLYLPAESVPDFWRIAASPACRSAAEAPACQNRDHPSFLMAYGFIPGARIDPATMRRTFDAVERNWDLRQTWGWDFPMMAMTAARLGMPGKAVDWLLADRKNNNGGRPA